MLLVTLAKKGEVAAFYGCKKWRDFQHRKKNEQGGRSGKPFLLSFCHFWCAHGYIAVHDTDKGAPNTQVLENY